MENWKCMRCYVHVLLNWWNVWNRFLWFSTKFYAIHLFIYNLMVFVRHLLNAIIQFECISHWLMIWANEFKTRQDIWTCTHRSDEQQQKHVINKNMQSKSDCELSDNILRQLNSNLAIFSVLNVQHPCWDSCFLLIANGKKKIKNKLFTEPFFSTRRVEKREILRYSQTTQANHLNCFKILWSMQTKARRTTKWTEKNEKIWLKNFFIALLCHVFIQFMFIEQNRTKRGRRRRHCSTFMMNKMKAEKMIHKIHFHFTIFKKQAQHQNVLWFYSA